MSAASDSPARRFKLTVAYDGTVYAGWQVQPRHVSVQQVIEETLETIVGHTVKVHGSGRTDQGRPRARSGGACGSDLPHERAVGLPRAQRAVAP